ncbi:MAG TPA: hypothetical protein LFW21_07835 [Rickettsia endosymbiont of Pyrocoelia pectoralis]|nr:hypothetical protein [Rickettsia endosymbiont of Pyrocoelia pectoralis]
MNKNLKRFFVTTAIITSLTHTSDAHATSVIEQRYNEEGLEGVADYMDNRLQWVNGLDEMTESVMMGISFVQKKVAAEQPAAQNNPTVVRVINIIDDYIPLKEEAKKKIQEKEERKAQKLKEKQAKEAQKLQEADRVRAEVALAEQEKKDAELKAAEAKENERKEWEKEKAELISLRNLVLRSQPLNDLQRSRYNELEKKEKEKKKEQAK